ncbi:hypothetical protein JCM10908_002772 [Rhodotorula pacifica]|uniref:O-fucosyltransferase family protein n=1 Tax=Rhodotorula pacifica TaxID=1495444 RepID=UPI00317AEFE0
MSNTIPYQPLPGGATNHQQQQTRRTIAAALQFRPARLAVVLATATFAVVTLFSFAAGGPTNSVQIAKAALDKTTTTVQGWVGKAGKDTDEDAEQPPYVRPRIEDLRNIVGDNPRYLTKDGWATYGYNNQRYMLEATLALARTAGRIPVLPDAVWARSCAVEPDDICAEKALIFYEHRNEHQDQVAAKWNEDGKAYKLGIEHFLDVPHLRRTYGPLLLYSEFLALYNLSNSLFDESLRWRPDRYTPAGLKSATLPDTLFQNDTFTRIDKPPPPRSDAEIGFSGGRLEQLSRSKVEKTLSARPVWNVRAARDALQKEGVLESDGISDPALVRMLEPVGVVPLYTYSDYVLMNKALSHPTIELALASKVQALSTTLEAKPYKDADIVYLAGNLHDQRKPGGVRFSTSEARDDFTNTIVRGLRAPREIRQVGERIAERMKARVVAAAAAEGGNSKQKQEKKKQLWMAAHLRRGDFVEIAWSPEKDAEAHFDRLLEALREGRETLAARVGKEVREFVPQEGDPFYLATDETNSTSLSYFRSHGAVLLSDLLTPADTALLSWPASYNDVLSVVEQQVLARADFFVGSELSSTTGGAVNVRTRLGKEEWSWSVLLRGTDLGQRQDNLRVVRQRRRQWS